MKRAADSQRLVHSIQKKQKLMKLPEIHIGDEIIFSELAMSGQQEFKEGVWIVRAFDRTKGVESVVLQRHYNNWEMLEPDRIIRPQKYVKKELLEKLANKSVLHITNAVSDHSIVQQLTSSNLLQHRRSVRNLPPHLQEAVRAQISSVTPIPIEYRIRRLATRCLVLVADSARMRILTDPGKSEWAKRTWRLHPSSLSYFAIWSACARELEPSKPEVPLHTEATFWMEPVQGPAAFMRKYVEACRRGDPSFPLVFDSVWAINATVIACGPHGRLKMGYVWRRNQPPRACALRTAGVDGA